MITFKRLGASRPANTSNATLYTVPALTTTYLKSLAICNTTTSDATCRVFLVPSGGTTDQTTSILYDYIITANQSVFLSGIDHILEAAGTIQVQTGTGSALTFTASGQQIT